MTENIEITRPTDNWSSDDFIEPEEQDLAEDDPWGCDTLPEWSLDNDTKSNTALLAQLSDGTAGLVELRNDDLLSDGVDAYEVHYGLEEALPATNNTESIDISVFEEPDPDIEGKSDLRQSLFDQFEQDLNISQRIKINEFLANLEAPEEDHISHIVELLEGLGNAKLMRWLPWLRDQAWTGPNLLLFLGFRIIWEHTLQWWETSFWSDRDGWRLYYNPYSLSLDDTYELIRSRLDCSPDDVVDKRWVEEWENLAPWNYGFQSFASFILFRSRLEDHTDWHLYFDSEMQLDKGKGIYHPEYNVENKFGSFTGLVNEYSVGSQIGRTPHQLRSPAAWFKSQAYYDPSEWHDNLD